ncbi:type IV pilus modification PilV family protein [Idiomarina ramblicola]|uniref:Pili assembly chaperone n=1 Tax=Idiomarina ramblicola TaxID=263724 RepID=A0A432Z252_9GAMM|nr:prepilin-type N-terminal cleavage/methylation domain-containing protein [Idiomarina ramblicola]RUO71947.1 pili assembly chaperone [Idiomarina ramblicola]
MSAKKRQGFTLIELIIGIVVIAIVALAVTSGLGLLSRQTVDPWQQVRAAELGQSLMNDIMARKFDANNTSILRCSENTSSCTNPLESQVCPDEGEELPNIENGEVRSEFDDVDDFNCLGTTQTDLTNILGDDIEPSFYRGFSAEVRVYSVEDNVIKQINVVIITPQEQRIEFSAQRGNW